MLRIASLLIAACAFLTTAGHARDLKTEVPTESVDAARQTQLVRMVRQDCGSCHGIQLTGGLGPALTRERMADFPYDSLVAVIYNGRPGTPMPGWKTMISEADAHWIARQLQDGFPLEAARTAP
ncbi:MAG: cytochrome c [Pseudomonadota bacterium]|nr:cytochrome c [Pseudomonadota bacterium]